MPNFSDFCLPSLLSIAEPSLSLKEEISTSLLRHSLDYYFSFVYCNCTLYVSPIVRLGDPVSFLAMGGIYSCIFYCVFVFNFNDFCIKKHYSFFIIASQITPSNHGIPSFWT